MNRIWYFGILILFAAAGHGCSAKPVENAPLPPSNVEAANTAAESPFASITDASAALAEGKRLLDENQTETAIHALKRAIELDPDLPEAHFQLGIAYSLLELQMQQNGEVDETPANSKTGVPKKNSQKAFEHAVAAYKKWLAANPKDDVAQFNLGRTYAKLGEDEDAEKAFRQAVKLKEDDTEYQTELGAILIKLAKYHEAVEPLKEAIKLDDQNVRAQDLLEDAEAGKQRLDYVSNKKDNNQSTGKSPGNSNSSLSSNSNSAAPAPASNANSRAPAANVKPKPSETKDKRPNLVTIRP